jgi:23S rRNA (cytidine1920-2'-O)/16S rRNA (cytidine1409-2'-O)-methyltransferase
MIRVDVFLVREGYSKSRESAQRSIDAGLVVIDGIAVKKPSEKIDETQDHSVICENTIAYVGRGGLKLEAALDAFGIDPSGKICFDVGASTGGFTDCLLKRGADRVYAIDSGRDQLAKELRDNERVVSLEGVNARFLDFDSIGSYADIIVMDVSFISQTLILPRFPLLLNDCGEVVTLIKPQFECGREALGKGGIVKKPEHRLSAVRRVISAARDNGLFLHALIRSPIEGGDGNVEFLAHFKKDNNCLPNEIILGRVDYK